MKPLLAFLAATAILACTTSALGAAPSSTSPITVETSLSPRSIYFADVVRARVDVVADRRRVDPASVQIATPFGPWRQLRQVRSATESDSSFVHRTWWFTIACFAQSCVPRVKSVRAEVLPKLTVSGRTTGGMPIQVRQSWPVLNVATRFAPPAVHALVNLRTQRTVPAAIFRFSPTWLSVLFTVVGALLVAAGIGLAVVEVARRRRPRTVVDRRAPLVRSLELVRKAEGGEVEERRRAVGLLARVLPKEDHGLAGAASEVAWSNPDPSPDELEDLARRVEAQLEESQ
jgi:hypothetical protein